MNGIPLSRPARSFAFGFQRCIKYSWKSIFSQSTYSTAKHKSQKIHFTSNSSPERSWYSRLHYTMYINQALAWQKIIPCKYAWTVKNNNNKETPANQCDTCESKAKRYCNLRKGAAVVFLNVSDCGVACSLRIRLNGAFWQRLSKGSRPDWPPKRNSIWTLRDWIFSGGYWQSLTIQTSHAIFK